MLKNTLRFVWKSSEEFMDRKVFGQAVLFGALCLNSDDLLCLQRNAKEKFYDVTFYTITKMEEARGLAARLADGPLKSFQVQSLCRTGERIVTVHIYNPWVSEEATRYFLARYATVLSDIGEIRDALGIWTGKRQFRVMLKDDPNGYDGFCHPPATFTIGTNRGYLIYAGQPKYCRQCASYGHLATSCRQVRCRNCDSLGHTMRDCEHPRKCSLCGSEGHLFKNCHEVTSTYANATKGDLVMNKAQRMERPVVDDPQAPSLRAIEDVIAELTRDREIEASVAGPPDETPFLADCGGPCENLGNEVKSSEENSSVAEWVTVENRSRKGKRKRIRACMTLSPPLPPSPAEASRYSAPFSEVLDDMQEEKEIEEVYSSNDGIAMTEETGSATSAYEGEDPENVETEKSLTQQNVTASDSSRSLPNGDSGLAVTPSDGLSDPESCPSPSEDSPLSPEPSFPTMEPGDENFLSGLATGAM